MKKPFFILLLLCWTYSSQAQLECTPGNIAKAEEYMQEGQRLVEVGDYVQAMQYYNSAKLWCPDKTEAVDLLFEDMSRVIKRREQELDSINRASQKLIDAFYFYDDKYALAFGEKNIEGEGNKNVFYFIDQQGNEVEKLGRWQKAEQFEQYGNGFAKVWGKEGIEQYLDTLGNAYPVAYTLADLKEKPNSTALDLSEQQ